MHIRTPTLVARLSRDATDIHTVQRLRKMAFGTEQIDADRFDQRFSHVLVEEVEGQRLIGCLRVIEFEPGDSVLTSYCGQHYDLGRIGAYEHPLLELGRFCVASQDHGADVVRLIWAMVAKLVKRGRIGMLFGCTSFPGTFPNSYADAFGLLGAHHLAPSHWMPDPVAPAVVKLEPWVARGFDMRTGKKQLPPLLRSYLSMGGWVSDHGVIDRELDTIHFFTGLEVAKIPLRRAQRLRQLSA